jgi:hypothetical protein
VGAYSGFSGVAIRWWLGIRNIIRGVVLDAGDLVFVLGFWPLNDRVGVVVLCFHRFLRLLASMVSRYLSRSFFVMCQFLPFLKAAMAPLRARRLRYSWE